MLIVCPKFRFVSGVLYFRVKKIVMGISIEYIKMVDQANMEAQKLHDNGGDQIRFIEASTKELHYLGSISVLSEGKLGLLKHFGLNQGSFCDVIGNKEDEVTEFMQYIIDNKASVKDH